MKRGVEVELTTDCSYIGGFIPLVMLAPKGLSDIYQTQGTGSVGSWNVVIRWDSSLRLISTNCWENGIRISIISYSIFGMTRTIPAHSQRTNLITYGTSEWPPQARGHIKILPKIRISSTIIPQRVNNKLINFKCRFLCVLSAFCESSRALATVVLELIVLRGENWPKKPLHQIS
jgi:hypothetical protein